MLLTETHLHTSTGSACASVHPAEIPALYKQAGYKNIIVTDHYYKFAMDNLYSDMDDWLTGYRIVRKEGKSAGINVFLGMELRLTCMDEDFLVYGFDEEFLHNNRLLYELTPTEVYALLDANGCLIYQAHPFREYVKFREPSCLHGVEVHNGNPRHKNHNDKALAFAKKNSLLMISGSDFHEYEDIGRGGIYLDAEIETEKELVQYLKAHTSCGGDFLHRAN